MNTAKIIAVTQPLVKSQNDRGGTWLQKGEVATGPYMTAEEFIEYDARGSHPGNQTNTLNATKLPTTQRQQKTKTPF